MLNSWRPALILILSVLITAAGLFIEATAGRQPRGSFVAVVGGFGVLVELEFMSLSGRLRHLEPGGPAAASRRDA